MKQDWEEQTIRQLFRDERQADESQAPHFAGTLEAALSRRRKYSSRRLIFRVAFAVVALVAVIGFVRFLLIRSGNEQQAIVAQEPLQPDKTTPAPMIVEVTPSLTGPPPRTAPGTRRHRRSPAPADSLISQWRSPTDFLLRTPGDQLLKTVPRVGTSAIEIKVNFSDQKN
jgi:hypothetical protein